MPEPFVVNYADGRTSLVMKANLREGWAKLQKTYGFFHQTWIPYKDDLKIRAQLSLIAQPATFDSWAAQFPDVLLAAGDESLGYTLKDLLLTVKVALHPDQPWRKTQQGRPELYIEELPLFTADQNHWFDLRGWIIFHDGSRRPVPDVRVWTEHHLVVPGGQFESNRRRH